MCIAVRKVDRPLRELTCHRGSHSVTCHPADLTFPEHSRRHSRNVAYFWLLVLWSSSFALGRKKKSRRLWLRLWSPRKIKWPAVISSDGIACRILIQNELLEQVDTFPYLGFLITEDGECTTEFHNRLNKGQTIGASLQKVWKSHSIPISTKIRLTKALVWPVATYGCESWTLRKNEETRLDAFEMKGTRKILRVSWTAKKTNEWVLNKAGVKRELLDTVKARKLA